MRIRIVISYFGEGYVGWQHQTGGGSIQDELQAAILRLTGESVDVVGSGRTDAGVHALGQVAHFDLAKSFAVERIAAGLNFYLPKSIRISSAEEVDSDFNARKSAKQKTYIYLMYLSKHEHALLCGRALRVEPTINIPAMQAAAKHFEGTHDFYAFMSAGSSAKTTTRTILSTHLATIPPTQTPQSPNQLTPHNAIFDNSQMSQSPNQLTPHNAIFDPSQMSHPQDLDWLQLSLPKIIVFSITANGFLYNMVRKIVGTLIRVGNGKLSPNQIPHLIQNKTRSDCKDTAPPQALYLHHVKYPPKNTPKNPTKKHPENSLTIMKCD